MSSELTIVSGIYSLSWKGDMQASRRILLRLQAACLLYASGAFIGLLRLKSAERGNYGLEAGDDQHHAKANDVNLKFMKTFGKF